MTGIDATRWPRQRLDSLAVDEPYSFAGGPFGSTLTSRDYIDEGVPVIRGRNLRGGRFLSMDHLVYVSNSKAHNELSGNLARAGDLIFTQRGTLGQVAIVPENGVSSRYVVSQSQMKLTVNDTLADKLFLYYYFSSREAIERIANLDSSSGVPHINLATLRRFEVPVPPLRVQRRVASVLSAYDDLIENNRRRFRLLEQSARLLYQEWFVHLRFPGHESTAVIDGVPEGWEKRRLDELADVMMGQSPPSSRYNEVGEGLPFHQGVGDFGDQFVTHRVFTTAKNRVSEPGDILCSVRAPVGRLNVTTDRIVIGRGLAAIRSKFDRQSFLLRQLHGHFFKEDIIGTGAIFASVGKKELVAQRMLTPDGPLISLFEDQTRPIDKQLRALFIENGRLGLARDLLLPRVMNGEIAV